MMCKNGDFSKIFFELWLFLKAKWRKDSGYRFWKSFRNRDTFLCAASVRKRVNFSHVYADCTLNCRKGELWFSDEEVALPASEGEITILINWRSILRKSHKHYHRISWMHLIYSFGVCVCFFFFSFTFNIRNFISPSFWIVMYFPKGQILY